MTAKKTSQSTRVRTRSANWTDSLDAILLRVLREQNLLGNCADGQVKIQAWKDIVPAFNQQSRASLAKNHLQNRLKVLKNTFYLYYELTSRSGWGWDCVLNRPKPESSSDWESVISVNPKYAKCKDRPFPAYKDLEVLCGKSTGFGKLDTATRLDDDGSGDDTSIDALEMARVSLDNGVLPSSPMPTQPTPISSSPNPSNPRTPLNECPIEHHEAPRRKRPRCSSSAPCTCKAMSSSDREVLSELVEISRQCLEMARGLIGRDLDARPKMYTVGDCIEKLSGLQGLADDAMLAVVEAFRDGDNRSIFMGLNGSLLSAWIGRQLAIQSEAREDVNK